MITLFYFLYNDEGKNMNIRSINKKMRYLGSLTAILGFGLIANTANADLLFATQNNSPQNAAAARDLDLNGPQAGGQTITFNTSRPNTLIRVIFNAVGARLGNFSATLGSTIFIDPAGPTGPTVCPPSGSNNVFVSGNGTPNVLDGWVSAVTQCTYTVPTAGVHQLRVRMIPTPAGQWQIDDISLVIDR
ncbi:hypothetical protein [Methylobacter sp. BlB1]|uniref:hypothetical protein n=1 Tax=Methylobacter sp. BlB1 TaxID=2785914 RepID=UPI0018932E84|nr:hypothetical protein [Methylobacter sp. BlB1]MBF6647189.1 hypothetical protein [Methylobacter sp. BlB1]